MSQSTKIFWFSFVLIFVSLFIGRAFAQFNFSIEGPIIPSPLSGTQAKGRFVGAAEIDLTRAGFVNVKSVAEKSGQYLAPAQYFGVNNNQVLLVFNLPTAPQTLFNYGTGVNYGALGKIATIADGRTAINFVAGGHYVVIIGPDVKKVTALADILVEKLK